jgi:two-component system CheB/CheR fusion protein
MGAELQKKLIPLFHYAVNPGGFLFLGTSETIGDFADLFSTADRKAKLYKRKEDVLGMQRVALGRFIPPLSGHEGFSAPASGKPSLSVKMPLRELTEQALLQQLAPVGALVNRQGDILFLHGRTGMYLEPAPGESGVNNVLKMAREGLRRDLTTALHKAAEGKEVIHLNGLHVKTNGHFTTVDVTIRPVAGGPGISADTPLFLIILEEAAQQDEAMDETTNEGTPPAGESSPGTEGKSDADARIAALKQELRAKEEYLQTTNEELETANEELKSSNEEMQSVNEELQSTNEELETSKEELQSVNEELATVNAELQMKVADLLRANNDMNNLLAGTGIGTVFVDHHLRILRFTPAATRIINLIHSDVGRPVSHIVSNLIGYDSLSADAQSVLDTLIPKEVEVQTLEGTWYTMCLQPYRTLDNVIEGAVITFVDITERKRAEIELRESDARFQQLAESLPQLVWTSRPDGLYDYLGPQWTEYTGLPVAQMLGFGWLERVHPDDRSPLMLQWNAAVANGEPLNCEFRMCHKDGSYHTFTTRATVVRDGKGNIVKWFGLNMDKTGSQSQ